VRYVTRLTHLDPRSGGRASAAATARLSGCGAAELGVERDHGASFPEVTRHSAADTVELRSPGMHAGTRAAITRMTTDKPAWLPQEAAMHGVSQAQRPDACALALCRFGGPAIVAPVTERQTGSFATPAFARVCPKLLLPFCKPFTYRDKGMLHCNDRLP